LQNADDATASSIEIHFHTANPNSLASIRTEKVTRITVKNDGLVFNANDWQRLKTIAEGQPSETAIGAFGVGFYSIWSHSDDPLVISGDQMMYFYWKGNQLAVKRATTPSATEVAPNGRAWTSVAMPCREPEPMPNPADCKLRSGSSYILISRLMYFLFIVSRFLATSLAFTAHIQSMTLYLDSHQLCKLEKKAAPARPLQSK